jgi:hypothetical protein
VSDYKARTFNEAIQSLCGGYKTQSAKHIKTIHEHCATRLILEGGFPPDWISPRPGLESKRLTNVRYELKHSPEKANPSEQAVLGGWRYKNADVGVIVPGIGPGLCISIKSTANAFRNLTNRMDEAPGDCANLHMMYPGAVFGYLAFIKYQAPGKDVSTPDVSFNADGTPTRSIRRYHDVLAAISGRSVITDSAMRFEAVALVVYRCVGDKAELYPGYPASDSPVHYRNFFTRMYELYDLRFSYLKPNGPAARKLWSAPSLGLAEEYDEQIGFPWEPRFATPEAEAAEQVETDEPTEG